MQCIKDKIMILWFRNDLRVHDNPVLDWAAKNAAPGTHILPVFCFDPRFHTKSVPKFKMTRKSGYHRTVFTIESVIEFRANL